MSIYTEQFLFLQRQAIILKKKTFDLSLFSIQKEKIKLVSYVYILIRRIYKKPKHLLGERTCDLCSFNAQICLFLLCFSFTPMYTCYPRMTFQLLSSIKGAMSLLLVAILHQLMACLFVYPIAQQTERGIRSTQLYHLFQKKWKGINEITQYFSYVILQIRKTKTLVKRENLRCQQFQCGTFLYFPCVRVILGRLFNSFHQLKGLWAFSSLPFYTSSQLVCFFILLPSKQSDRICSTQLNYLKKGEE